MFPLVKWIINYVTTLRAMNVTKTYLIKVLLKKNKRYPSQIVFLESDLQNVRQLYVKRMLGYLCKNNMYKNLINHTTITRAISLRIITPIPCNNPVFQRHIMYFVSQIYN